MITCKICGQEFRAITNTHLAKHGLTTKEYGQRHGEVFSLPLEREARHKIKRSWLQGFGLGQKPDSLIAIEANVSRCDVARIRQEIKIPAFYGAVLTQEGNPCRSVYEAIYDAYLHWKQIRHKHEVRVSTLPYIADFYVETECDNRYVEVIGMLLFAKYKNKYEVKRSVYEDHGICVDWLLGPEVKALYSSCPVKLVVRTEHNCIRCGKQTNDLVRGYCRESCYMNMWRKQQPQVLCQQCGSLFPCAPNAENSFCSRHCYWKSKEGDWPCWEWLQEKLQNHSVAEIASELQVSANALHQRIYRRKARNNGILI